MLVQGALFGRLAKRCAESRLIFVSVAVVAVALLAWAFVPNVLLLLIVLAPLSAAAGVLNSAITNVGYPVEVGGALGVWAPGVSGAVIMVWLVSYVWRWIIRVPDPPLLARESEL